MFNLAAAAAFLYPLWILVRKWLAIFGIVALACLFCYGCGRLHHVKDRVHFLDRLLHPFRSVEPLPSPDLEIQ